MLIRFSLKLNAVIHNEEENFFFFNFDVVCKPQEQKKQMKHIVAMS